MAVTTVAYGSITILDLLDTATYIYYSANSDGSGATIAPQLNSKYIGIYSGESVGEQPATPPSGTIWSKYVGADGKDGQPGAPGKDGKDGKDGEDGSDGRGITQTKIFFAKGNSKENHPTSGWTEDIKTALSQTGNYLWTKTVIYYTDGSSEDAGYSISSLSDQYEITTAAQKVTFYYNEKKELIVSPAVVSFNVRNRYSGDTISLNNSTAQLEITGLDGGLIASKALAFEESVNDNKIEYYARFNIKDYLLETPENCALVFIFTQGENTLTKKINVENTVPKELFAMNQYMYGFEAIMRNTILSFDEEGMTLENGRFIIKDSSQDQPLLKSENGNLEIRGLIHAQAGGTIGGFNIGQNQLTSIATDGQGNPYITIIGGNIDNNSNESGLIKAQKIILGTGAIIESYINLGENVRLLNPDKDSSGNFITANKLSMTNQGLIKLGDTTNGIEIFGGSQQEIPYIKSTQGYWSILGDGKATFGEIEAKNLTLHNAILTAGSTQAVGSSMVYRPSYPVKNWDESGKRIDIDSEEVLQVGTWVYVNKAYLKIITSQAGTFTYTGTVTGITKDSIVINLGKPGTDCVPSLFGGKTGAPSFSEPNSLVFAEITENQAGQIGFYKKVILGDLGSTRGFGLYGENVYLKGSLVTETNTGGPYAGINTMYGTDFEDQGKIVFWAGATSEANVTSSPFFVTDAGFLRARNANIIGSTFSGTVVASEIKAATIRGSAVNVDDMTSQDGTLTILDAGVGEGIIFAKTEDETQKQIFSIGPDGMKTGSLEEAQYFIKIENERASFVATNGDKKIIVDGSEAALNLVHKGNKQFSIRLNENNEGAIFINEVDLVSFEGGKTKIKSALSAYGEVDFGEGKMTYKKVAEGYNLYIS